MEIEGVHRSNDVLGLSLFSMMDQQSMFEQQSFIEDDFNMEEDLEYYNRNFIFLAQPEGEVAQQKKLENILGIQVEANYHLSSNHHLRNKELPNECIRSAISLKHSQELLNQSQHSQSSKQYSETDCTARQAEWKQSQISSSNQISEPAKKIFGEEVISKDDKSSTKSEQQATKILQEKQLAYKDCLDLMNPKQTFYFISGDVCIMNNFHSKDLSFDRFSGLNSFKAPVKTYTSIPNASLEVELNQITTGLSDFRFIIDRLKTLSSQQSYDLACLLEKYQVQVNGLKAKKALLADEAITEKYTTYLQKSFNDFEHSANIFLEKLAKTTTFYTYTYYRLNLMSLEMQMCKFGYSEAFLALLGLDYNLAQHQIWRRGLFDYLDKSNIGSLLYSLIASQIGGFDPQQQYDVTLHTFDNLEVYAKAQNKIFLNTQPESLFLPYNEILSVSIIDVNPTMVTQVMEIRKLTREKNLKHAREIEEDLQYSMEATTFLDKYYKNRTDGFLPSNKRAGFKVIRNNQIDAEVSQNSNVTDIRK